MNKLKSTHLKNFESWEDQLFEWHPGVNILVGLSDNGKSGVIRSIRLVTENKPTGDKYRSDFAGKKAVTEVKQSFDDGVEATRIRSNSENKYLLKTPCKKEQTFEAFNSSVPDEIQTAINLTPTNIQRQIELPFLLSQNPPDRGRFFNEIAGLDQIDTSQKYANAKVLEEGRESASCEKEIKRIEEELKELDFIPDLESKIDSLRILQGLHDQLKIKIDRASVLYAQWYTAQSELSELEEIDVDKISKKIKSALADIQEYRTKKAKIEKIETLNEDYTWTSTELFHLEKQDFSKISKSIKTGLQYIAKYREKRSHLSQIKRSFDLHVLTKGQLEGTEKQLIREQKEFKKAKPDICPLCKRGGWNG